jgi:hypothetical protein
MASTLITGTLVDTSMAVATRISPAAGVLIATVSSALRTSSSVAAAGTLAGTLTASTLAGTTQTARRRSSPTITATGRGTMASILITGTLADSTVAVAAANTLIARALGNRAPAVAAIAGIWPAS